MVDVAGWAKAGDWLDCVLVGAAVPLGEIGDAELALRIANQRSEGLHGSRAEARAEEGELCRRFAPRVRLYGLRHLGDEAAADDLVQRVLILTLRKLRARQIRDPERIASFILGAARTTCLEIRRTAGREETHDPETIEVAVSPAEPLPLERLAGCLDALGHRERTVVVLSFYQDQDAATIAQTLAIKEGNVRVIRHRSLERLRACLGEQPPGAEGRPT